MTARPKPAAETIAASIAFAGLSVALFIGSAFVGGDDPYGYLSSTEESAVLVMTIFSGACGIASTVLLAVGIFRLVSYADQAALRRYDDDLMSAAERTAELKRYYAQQQAQARDAVSGRGLDDRTQS